MNPNATIKSNSGPDFWTIGRTSIGTRTDINYLYRLSEVALQTGPTTVYMRQLRAWDIRNPFNIYQAFQGTKADGTKFWILVDCGNYTQVGKYTPKAPDLELRKTVAGGTTNLKPGDSFTFRFEYRNRIPDSLAENVVLHDDLDLTNYDIVSPTNLLMVDGRLRQPVGNLSYTANYNVLDIKVRLKNPFPGDNGKSCNISKLTSTNAAEVQGGPACVTVTTPCPYNPALKVGDAGCKPPVDVCPNIDGNQETVPTGRIKDASGNCVVPPDFCPNINGAQGSIPADKVLNSQGNCVDPCKYDPTKPTGDPSCVKASVVCSIVDTYLDKAKREATFKTTVTSSDEKQTSVVSYAYDFGDNTTVVTKESKLYTDTVKHVYGPGVFTAKVTVVYGATGVEGKQKVDCSAPIEFEKDKPLGEMKTIKNITQKLEGEKAIGSVVNGGDVLEYTLTTTNTQEFERKNYTAVDYVGDLTDYADVDVDFLKEQGGTYDAATKKISFVLASIGAKKDISKMFRVKVKNPIPATNQPSAVSGTYDCKISNKYGNDLTMSVNCPTVKGIETLPNTGPGTSLAMGFVVTTIVGYFFARSRLMSKELSIIRSEYAPTGGF